MTSIKRLFDEAVNQVSPTDWQNAIKHILDVENSYWMNDNVCDIEIEQVLFMLGEDSATETDQSDDDDQQ